MIYIINFGKNTTMFKYMYKEVSDKHSMNVQNICANTHP